MAAWGCLDCTTVYSVGAPRCPHCGSTNYTENPMPKITVAGGPSHAADRPAPENPSDSNGVSEPAADAKPDGAEVTKQPRRKAPQTRKKA